MDNQTHKLVMYNDDYNPYLYVIACLIKFCKHDPLQAEQCAVIADKKGKCSIKSGDFINMLDLKSTFESVNIKTEIEVYEGQVH
jgi:ATP-dependent Clp protease adaptor protein ClpS